MQAVPHYLSAFQWEALRGTLMGDGAISPTRSGHGARLRYCHGAAQVAYADWKASLFGNLEPSRHVREDGVVQYDFQPLAELAELRRSVYVEGKKVLDDEYLKGLTPLSIALWYMDDANFTIRSKGVQKRTKGGTGRAEICVEAMEPASRERLVAYLADTWGIHGKLTPRGAAGKAVLRFTNAETAKLHALIAPFVHPSMDYKLLPAYRGRFAVEPVIAPMRYELMALPVTDIHVKPPTKHSHRFDIEVEGSHNYLVDGVVVHNSPETTPGGRALKFYSSIRLDIRRIETIKDGAEMVGNRTRVKVVKNKCVAAGTTVFDPTTGITHRIEDIVERGEGAAVVAADKAGKLHVRPIVARMDQGEHEVIGLHLRGGTELWVTADHKVLTDTGWREAGELVAGDRLARPRQALGFGEEEPVRPAHARMLGYMIGDSCDPEKRIPASIFGPEVSAEVIGNLMFGLWESNGWASREQTGAVRCGFATISEQLAHQLHWLLLRFGIGSSVRRDLSIQKRPSIIGEWGGQGTHSCYQVRIGGMDNVARFAESVPMWGHKGKKLTEVLGEPAPVRYRGSQQGYLSIAQTEPILAYLERRGVTAALAAQLVGPMGGDPKGGMRQVLGASRLRRDRVQVLADALESPFLAEVLDEEVWYDRITAVSPPEWRPIYDIEVAEHHTFVANDVVVSNCARPFQQAEFDIMYGSGISREGSLLDVAVDLGFIKKSGAWFTYEGEQLGQGRENVKTFLRENPQLMAEVDERVRQHLAPSEESEEAEVDPAAEGTDPDDEPISLSD
jgi:RecA/RadA recombinase